MTETAEQTTTTPEDDLLAPDTETRPNAAAAGAGANDDADDAFWKKYGHEEDSDGDGEAPQTRAATDTQAAATDREIDRAVAALKRDNVPDSVIAGMLKANPQELKAWGAKAAARQSESDSYANRLRELEQKGGQTAAAKADESKPNPGSEGAAGASDIQALLAEQSKQFDARLQESIRAAELRHEVNLAYRFASAGYGAKAPPLADVIRKADDLGRANPGGYASVQDLVDASFRELAGAAPAQSRATVGTQPTPRSASSAPPPRATDDDEDVAFDLLAEGKTRDEVKAALRDRRK